MLLVRDRIPPIVLPFLGTPHPHHGWHFCSPLTRNARQPPPRPRPRNEPRLCTWTHAPSRCAALPRRTGAMRQKADRKDALQNCGLPSENDLDDPRSTLEHRKYRCSRGRWRFDECSLRRTLITSSRPGPLWGIQKSSFQDFRETRTFLAKSRQTPEHRSYLSFRFPPDFARTGFASGRARCARSERAVAGCLDNFPRAYLSRRSSSPSLHHLRPCPDPQTGISTGRRKLSMLDG
jgi:hypothetical protein